jgi:hypothetical protein
LSSPGSPRLPPCRNLRVRVGTLPVFRPLWTRGFPESADHPRVCIRLSGTVSSCDPSRSYRLRITRRSFGVGMHFWCLQHRTSHVGSGSFSPCLKSLGPSSRSQPEQAVRCGGRSTGCVGSEKFVAAYVNQMIGARRPSSGASVTGSSGRDGGAWESFCHPVTSRVQIPRTGTPIPPALSIKSLGRCSGSSRGYTMLGRDPSFRKTLQPPQIGRRSCSNSRRTTDSDRAP